MKILYQSVTNKFNEVTDADGNSLTLQSYYNLQYSVFELPDGVIYNNFPLNFDGHIQLFTFDTLPRPPIPLDSPILLQYDGADGYGVGVLNYQTNQLISGPHRFHKHRGRSFFMLPPYQENTLLLLFAAPDVILAALLSPGFSWHSHVYSPGRPTRQSEGDIVTSARLRLPNQHPLR
jgi:hypothetical protein